MTDIDQHNVEIQENLEAWQRKPLLRRIYRDFYSRIAALIDPGVPGLVLEIGSGVGNLKDSLPHAIASDLFPNPWLDLVCDGYELPFPDNALSHIILFDVFHHLEAPAAMLQEARRVLAPDGRVIVFDPFVSLTSFPVYGCLHHEPIGWRDPINLSDRLSPPRNYYAAQGNATRLFFRDEPKSWLPDWNIFHSESLSAFSYVLSGGFSKPACYPQIAYPLLSGMDRALSHWPSLFGARCLVGLEPR
jgi:SAM-dependent methyltransferase